MHKNWLSGLCSFQVTGQSFGLLTFILQFPLLYGIESVNCPETDFGAGIPNGETAAAPSLQHKNSGKNSSHAVEQKEVLTRLSNNILAILGLVSAVSNLRGVWYLLDLYLFPGRLDIV